MTIPRSEKLLIAVLTTVHVTHVLDFVLMMPLGPHLRDSLGLSTEAFAHVLSAYTFSAAVTGLAAAFFIDRFDRKRALLALYAGFAVATLACALATGFWSLLVARVAAGACGGLLGALIFSIIGDVIPYQRRGAASGVVMSAFSIASVAGVPVGLWLANRYGWHSTFTMLSVISAAALVLAAVALPPMRAHLQAQRPAPMRLLRDIVGDGNHRAAFALNAAVMVAGFSVIPFIAVHLVDNVGVTKAQLGWIYFCGGVCTIATSRIVGRLADRFGKRRVFIACAVASIGSTLLLTELPRVSLPIALLCTTAFIVVGSSRFVPMMALTTGAVRDERRGSFMSVNSSVQSLASAIATDIAGVIVVEEAGTGRLLHYDRVGWIAVAAIVASVLLSLRVRAVGAAAVAEVAAGHRGEADPSAA